MYLYFDVGEFSSTYEVTISRQIKAFHRWKCPCRADCIKFPSSRDERPARIYRYTFFNLSNNHSRLIVVGGESNIRRNSSERKNKKTVEVGIGHFK